MNELAEAALDVAVETGDPIGQELAKILGQSKNPNLVLRLNDVLERSDYRQSVPLREVRLAVTQQIVEKLKQDWPTPDDSQRWERTRCLSRLSRCYSDLGLRQESIETMTQAAQLLLRGRKAGILDNPHGALTRLNRLARRRSQSRELLYLALARDMDHLALTAVLVAIESGGPIGLLTAEALEKEGTIRLSKVLGLFCSEQIHRASVPRWELGLTANQKALNNLREARTELTEEQQLDFTHLLLETSGQWSRIGRSEEGLQIAAEALDCCRLWERKGEDSGLIRPLLAQCLRQMGQRLKELGRYEEALELMEEAMEIQRALAWERPDVFRPELGTSLGELYHLLSNLGNYEEALGPARESLEIFRDLAHKRPKAFSAELALAHELLGEALIDLKKSPEAKEHLQEAVVVFRSLAVRWPDAFQADLATSLGRLGLLLSRQGLHEVATGATREAVGYLRDLSAQRPQVFQPELARCLRWLSRCLVEARDFDEALLVASEGVETQRRYTTRHPMAPRSQLATGLVHLSSVLALVERPAEALDMLYEAISMQRALSQQNGLKFMPDLAKSLEMLGNILDSLGKREEALAASQEAEMIRNGL